MELNAETGLCSPWSPHNKGGNNVNTNEQHVFPQFLLKSEYVMRVLTSADSPDHTVRVIFESQLDWRLQI